MEEIKWLEDNIKNAKKIICELNDNLSLESIVFIKKIIREELLHLPVIERGIQNTSDFLGKKKERTPWIMKKVQELEMVNSHLNESIDKNDKKIIRDLVNNYVNELLNTKQSIINAENLLKR